MQYVICYDIADDRRRDRVAKALLDYGPRVQESVFVANLDEELAAKMWERLGRPGECDTHLLRYSRRASGLGACI